MQALDLDGVEWDVVGTVVLPGKPVIKKNTSMIRHPSRRMKDAGRTKPWISPGKEYDRWEAEQKWRAVAKWSGKPRNIGSASQRVWLRMRFFLTMRQKTADLSNLYEAPQDVLETAGILSNDRYVDHHDGSRRFYVREGHRIEIDVMVRSVECG